jgi:hypothetical protein
MITVLADKQGVTATVNMTLSSDLAQRSPYRLTLAVTSVYPSQDVKFLVLFVHFPPAVSGTGPLHGPQNAHYTVINSAPGLSGVATQSNPLLTYRRSQSAKTSRGRGAPAGRLTCCGPETTRRGQGHARQATGNSRWPMTASAGKLACRPARCIKGEGRLPPAAEPSRRLS